MPRRFLWGPQTRREVTFAVTAAVMLVALVAYVVLARVRIGPARQALLVCVAGGITSILLSHNGVGEWPVLLGAV